jgi:hypothetical protein
MTDADLLAAARVVALTAMTSGGLHFSPWRSTRFAAFVSGLHRTCSILFLTVALLYLISK